MSENKQLNYNDIISIVGNIYPSLTPHHLTLKSKNVINQSSHEMVKKVFNDLQISYPMAGHAYWAIRCWLLLIWQPIYLSMITIHQLGVLLNVASIILLPRKKIIVGFDFLDKDFIFASKEHLIKTAGEQMQALFSKYYFSLNKLSKLKPLNAKRLTADTLLSCLIDLGVNHLKIGYDEIIRFSVQWLEAMNLKNQNTLKVIPLMNGDKQLIVRRKSCCMHYLINKADLCASCPKNKCVG